MHGGARDGSGRKLLENKKKPVTIYLDEPDQDAIREVALPGANSFSQKCKQLIDIGLDKLNSDLLTTSDEVTFVDLFCGLGGIRIGFENALAEYGLKGKCVFSSDIKKTAIRAYHNYFGENAECDITKINPSQIPNFDFLLAGFPCQAFSQAGARLGFSDTRGTLFFNISKILLEKQPQGFVLENVEGLVNHDHGKTFEVITRTLRELGYEIQYKVLNGKDFGLAQSRNRIYIVGLKGKNVLPLTGFDESYTVLKDILDLQAPPIESEFTNKLLSHFHVEELYGKAIKDKRGGANNIHSWDIALKGEVSEEQKILLEKLLKQRRNKKWASEIGIEWMDGMPLTEEMISTFHKSPKLHEMLEDLVEKGYVEYEYPKQKVGNKRIPDTSLKKGYNIVTGKLSFEFSKILSPFEVTPTLVATDVQKLAVPTSNGIRTLTVKEGLRLFGFPEEYELDFLKQSEAFDLLGNTVCVPVIQAVSSKLIASYLE